MRIVFVICLLLLIPTESYAKKYDILESNDDYVIIDTGFEQLVQTQYLVRYLRIADAYCSNLRKNSFHVVKQYKALLSNDIIRNYDQSYNILKFKGRVRFFCISDERFQTSEDMKMVNAMKIFEKYDKLMRKTFKSAVSQKAINNKIGQKGEYDFFFRKRFITEAEKKEREIAKKKREQEIARKKRQELALKRQQEIQRKKDYQKLLKKEKTKNQSSEKDQESSFSFKNTLGKMLGK